MTCPSPITHSMYADGALAAREAVLLEQHATTCAACRTRIEALRQESAALRLALRARRRLSADSPLRAAGAGARLRRARARHCAHRRLQQGLLEHGCCGDPERPRVAQPIGIGRALRACAQCLHFHRLRGNCYVDCYVELGRRRARYCVGRLARGYRRAPARVRCSRSIAACDRHRAAVDRPRVRDPSLHWARDACGRRDGRRHLARGG